MEKALSRNEVHRRADAFAARWRDATYERGESQTFWNEFLNVFGIDRKRVNAAFEHAALRASTGNLGFIDLFWPGVLLVEQKSAGKDLDKAQFQALDYLPSLAQDELPMALVMSDFKRVRIVRLDGETATSCTFDTADLSSEIDRFNFLTKQRDVVIELEEKANASAVKLMGGLYDQLGKSGYEGHEASVFMVRILFLLFGDDTGLWRSRLFEEFIEERTSSDGSDCGSQISALFQTLDRDVDKRSTNLDHVLAQFPFVNGGLFAERIDAPSFTTAMREALLECCRFGWAQISPAIFGSMFQTVKVKKLRREAGEHYTTEANILKTIKPLFLDELYDSFVRCGSELSKLQTFHASLGKLTFMDPACGCGNFLIVAYRELRGLELDVFRKIRAITGQDVLSIVDITRTLQVSPEQFHGIEINEWPAEIAKTAFFMVDHQANRKLVAEFGMAPKRLPIKITAHIHTANALSLDWADVCPPGENVIIFGNPPFSGRGDRTADQTADQKVIWKKQYNINLDYVTCWYLKAMQFFAHSAGRWAFVSTSSACQGEPVATLWRPILDAGWRCRFAHRSMQWDSEASGKAAVHVSIVGFDKAKTPKPTLWTYPEGGQGDGTPQSVVRINPYLVEGPNLLVLKRSKPLTPQLPEAAFGSMANDGGHLLVEVDEYQEVAADPVAAKYLRPFIGAKELLHDGKRWCLWMVNLDPADVGHSAILRARISAVRDHRADSLSPTTSRKMHPPQLFGQIAQPDTSYLGIPRHVSERRRYFLAARFQADVICGDANFLIPDPDGFALGVLSSTMFMTWQKTIGGRLRSDLRFSKTFSYNTFPLPSVSKRNYEAICAAAAGIVAARLLFPGVSLADLYNPLATPLGILKAHDVVDRAVDRAFESRSRIDSIQDRQKVLFRSYAKLTGQELLGDFS